jgi:hypothetical protein
MGKRLGSTVREDTVDNLLDRLAVMREEILAIERSLERIQDAKLEQGKDGSGKDGVRAH